VSHGEQDVACRPNGIDSDSPMLCKGPLGDLGRSSGPKQENEKVPPGECDQPGVNAVSDPTGRQ
jgi:hypothetical protein